ncbi:MAG TPA: amidohydrolase family protein [Gemmatimonadales bacterium]|nr:amidohydrolase family protein [Gemmatimonadales bacterium]
MGLLIALPVVSPGALAQARAPGVAPFIAVDDAVVALAHVRVIDGTGAPARDDQTLVIANGRIAALGPASSTTVPAGAKMLDKSGYTVIPGLVGMHDHLYYSASISAQRGPDGRIAEPGFYVDELPYSAPRLYLAAGVTTLRTTGSVEPYTDLKVRQRIESGAMPGPHIDVTAPYLEGKGTAFAQMHELDGPDDARRLVSYWSGEGMTSFKAYMNITRAELAAAVAEAHRLGHKLTGHLCSVTWPEAIAAGIDDFEHGPVFTDTEFVPDKKADECPSGAARAQSWDRIAIDGPEVKRLIASLVTHHVAVTSTLPVFELFMMGRPRLEQRVLDAMSAEARSSYLTERAAVSTAGNANALPEATLKKEMDFERAFAKAGGLLLAGPDPTGNGGVLPGFGDQREIELLVEAGFSAADAIRIATLNGARFLGRDDRIGALAPGKQADVVVIKGDPTRTIADIENVELVFKDGVGYDAPKLIESVRGKVGIW